MRVDDCYDTDPSFARLQSEDHVAQTAVAAWVETGVHEFDRVTRRLTAWSIGTRVACRTPDPPLSAEPATVRTVGSS
jgi:hypothetical protein